jgi:hypothetical protein
MKTFGTLLGLLSTRQRRENLRLVAWLVVALIVIVLLYSVIFHQLMAAEGRVYSWPTSIYWTIVTMSTLGFGDITFVSDAGRIFSVVVLISGILFLLVLLPFTVIQFVVAPWMDQREAAQGTQAGPTRCQGPHHRHPDGSGDPGAHLQGTPVRCPPRRHSRGHRRGGASPGQQLSGDGRRSRRPQHLRQGRC